VSFNDFIFLLRYTGEVSAMVQYGIKAKKICASCTDFTPLAECYQDFCGADTYGHDATVSGLLLLPVDASGDVLSGLLKVRRNN